MSVVRVRVSVVVKVAFEAHEEASHGVFTDKVVGRHHLSRAFFFEGEIEAIVGVGCLGSCYNKAYAFMVFSEKGSKILPGCEDDTP